MTCLCTYSVNICPDLHQEVLTAHQVYDIDILTAEVTTWPTAQLHRETRPRVQLRDCRACRVVMRGIHQQGGEESV